jgi:hypothetical protein
MLRRWILYSFTGIVLLLSCSAPTASTSREDVVNDSNDAITIFAQTPPAPLSPTEYIQWVNDPENNLVVRKELNGIWYELKYTPIDLLALRQLQNERRLTPEAFTAAKALLENAQYYTLSIGTTSGIDILKAGTRTDEDRTQRLEYFSSKMQKDILLVEGIDTMRCSMYQFENLNGLVTHSNFMLAFPERQSRKRSFPDKTFLLFDILFANGLVSMEINGADIRNIPNLDIKTDEK